MKATFLTQLEEPGVWWEIHGAHVKIETILEALAGVAQWTDRLAWKPKGHGFDSQSGHMPGLQSGPQ